MVRKGSVPRRTASGTAAEAFAPKRQRGRSSEAAIKLAALECFYEHGYHGTSVRGIAEKAAISVAGLYHHFSSKMEILFSLMVDVMTDLTAATEEALEIADAHPGSRLRAAVEAHVLFHTQRQQESFVSNTELRSLGFRKREAILDRRDAYERIFRGIIAQGVENESFRVIDPREASLAIVTMCTAVASWYRKGGRLSPEEVAQRYGDFALGMVGYREPGARAERQTLERTDEDLIG